MNADLQARLLDLYPVLGELPPSLRADTLAHHVWHVHAPAGTVLFTEGAPCRGFPMVLHGTVRVACGSQGGRSLELYRVTPGEMCVISTTCLFGQAPLSAEGVALEPTELVLLSAAGFSALARDGSVVAATLQDLAVEVGTVREIVTRLLRRFEASGHLRIGRGRIELLAPAALRRIAEGRDGDPGH